MRRLYITICLSAFLFCFATVARPQDDRAGCCARHGAGGAVEDTTYVPDGVPVALVDSIWGETDEASPGASLMPVAGGEGRRLHLKTNAVAWGLAIANVAAEVDLARHWSFTLPLYYSAWNYFTSTIKFRMFAVQPELRYWLSGDNDGLFAGAHFGLAYYNFAFNGNYRYQDHNDDTPAIGGGVAVGYRMPLRKGSRWRVEFALGAGVYPLHYDKFHNPPRTKDGLLVGSEKKTYWGIDQLAVSFSYTFDLKKKGGRP